MDLVPLIGIDERGHSDNLTVVFVRLRFLGIKGVDGAVRQHVGEDEVPYRSEFPRKLSQ